MPRHPFGAVTGARFQVIGRIGLRFIVPWHQVKALKHAPGAARRPWKVEANRELARRVRHRARMF